MTLDDSARSVKKALRRVAKSAVIASGALNVFHHARHRHALTVLMFHRVLPEQVIDKLGADPEYVISTHLLEQLIDFLKSNYTIVDLPDILASQRRERPLPHRPLLITFDDGWNDNALYAAPIFSKTNVPWTVFVATDALSPPDAWWQETLLWAFRTGKATYQQLWSRVPDEHSCYSRTVPDDPALKLLMRYGTLCTEEQSELLSLYAAGRARAPGTVDMLSLTSLANLHTSGVRVGVHSATHLPLTAVDDPEADIRRAIQFLLDAIGPDAVTTMSFPHGRYDERVISAARKADVQALFTSDPLINACPQGWLDRDVLGRVPISTKAIANSNGMLDLERLLPCLILRPVV